MALRSFLYGLLITLTAGQLAIGDQTEADRPNIVLVMTDDQGYGPIGAHGHPWIRTPNLDELYEQSTRFTRFLVSPTCSPTRAAIMSGRHPMKNGVTHTILERERMSLETVILPEALRSTGYATGIFGKWHLGDEDDYQPHKRGFEEAFIHGAGGIGQKYDCSCADVPGNKYFDPVIRHNGKFVQTSGYCTDLFFTAALGWIKQIKDRQPFFAYIATNAPHGPFHAPEKNAQRFRDLGFEERNAGFYGMIENIDENMGRLVAKLNEWQLLENTVLIFMSDNGTTAAGALSGKKSAADQPLGRAADGSDLLPFNAGMKGYKGSPQEGGVRVPFFVRWDGHFTPDRDILTIAAHIDIFPTLAELAQAAVPAEQVEGKSLLPLLEDENAAWEDRFLFTHVCRWPTGADPNESRLKNCAVRNQRFRLVNNSELYDMEIDPGQTRNVIDDHVDVVAKMRVAYDQFWDESLPLLVNEAAPMSPTRPFHEHFRRQQETSGIADWVVPQLESDD